MPDAEMKAGLLEVTAEMVLLLSSEDEIAAVLAHELAHYALAHDHETLESFHRLKPFALQRLQIKHEHDADAESLNLLSNAGYDPYAALDALTITREFLRENKMQSDQRHPSMSARIAYLEKQYYRGSFNQPTRLKGNVLKELSGSAAILSYPQHYWLRFGRTFVELEWDYLSAVTALHSRDAEPEATLARAQAAQGIGLRDRTTTLFRMAWEDVQNSQHLDQTIHPAFGIAVWLALADAQSIDSTDPRLSARIHFREAMGTVLAHAIVWARRFRSTAIPPQMGQLLLPEIFDLARSQRFDKRNL